VPRGAPRRAAARRHARRCHARGGAAPVRQEPAARQRQGDRVHPQEGPRRAPRRPRPPARRRQAPGLAGARPSREGHPAAARGVNLVVQGPAMTAAQAMRGELDYPQSLRKRVGLLKGLQEAALKRVYDERLRLTPGAEELLAACKKHGVKLLLVSGGFTFFTDRLKERLGIDYTISNRLATGDGRLTGELIGDIVDADAKAAKFAAVLAELGAAREQTVAIGDGANDLKMMAPAGLAIAFHAKPVVRAQASCAISWCGLDAVANLFE